MSPVPALDATVGFSLSVPESWVELDLRPATRAASAAELADTRTRGVPELRKHRAAVARLLRETATRAWSAGAAYCAVMAEPTADGLLTGCVTVSVVRRPLGSDGDPSDLLATFTPMPATSDGRWRELTTLDLPYAGPAARVAGVEEVDLEPGGPSVPSVIMQTFVPVPRTERVLVVSASSPALAIAPVLLDLFDAVTSTLRVVDPVAVAETA